MPRKKANDHTTDSNRFQMVVDPEMGKTISFLRERWGSTSQVDVLRTSTETSAIIVRMLELGMPPDQIVARLETIFGTHFYKHLLDKGPAPGGK